MLSFEEQYKNPEQALAAQLVTSPFWYLTAAGEQQTSEQQEVIGVLHSKTGRFYKRQDLAAFLKQHPFVGIWRQGQKQNLVLHTETGLVWSNATATTVVGIKKAKEVLASHKQLGLSNWRLPDKDEFYTFASSDDNPYRIGRDFRLKTQMNLSVVIGYVLRGVLIRMPEIGVYLLQYQVCSLPCITSFLALACHEF